MEVIDLVKVNAKNRTVVKFTNISDEVFTHSYDGVQLTLQSGAFQMMAWMEADHYAKHLARQMLSAIWKKKSGDRQKIEIKYTPEQVIELKKDMVEEIGQLPQAENLSKEEAKEKEREVLNKEFTPVPEVTKKDVIDDLKKRGVEVDTKKSKEELLEQVIELEAQNK